MSCPRGPREITSVQYEMGQQCIKKMSNIILKLCLPFFFFFLHWLMIFWLILHLCVLSRTHIFIQKLSNSLHSAKKTVSISFTEVFFICFLTSWFIISYRDEVGNTKKTHYHHWHSVLLTILSFSMDYLSAFAAIPLKIECFALKTGPPWQPDK